MIDSPPWARVTGAAGAGAGPGGVEPMLVRDFARELHAQVRWAPGPAPRLLAALEHGERDLVVGGFTESTPWRERVATTNPFFIDSVVVGVAPGAPPLRELDGERVLVALGDPAARDVRDEGGTPVVVDSLGAPLLAGEGSIARLPVATSAWRLPALQREPSRLVLREVGHVMLVPRGENGWLVRLERFLRGRRADVGERLRRERRPGAPPRGATPP
ncbi:MAG TPA: transporter substrate-binding domain-containing protein [Gemmatimonadaceae bacterium]|nr:transporter substrate-binding domain-containing protein [Gemmatimonadaceae bacterium]